MRPPTFDKHLAACVLLLAVATLAWTVAPAHAAPSPSASLSAAPASPLIGESVTFTSTSTAGPDKPIVKYEWDLDSNGTFETTTGGTPAVTYSYSKPGVVVVALRVTDSRGKTSKASLPVTVRSPGTPPPPPPPDDTKPPRASFIYSPGQPKPGEVITFASTSSDPGPNGAIAQESWDLNGDNVFGDAVGRSATATFAAGAHAVSLRVTDRAGLQSVWTQSLDIVADQPLAVLQLPSGRSYRLMRPFPRIRIAGRYTARGVHIRLFAIAASSRATVVARCSGRGCPFHRRTIASGAPGRASQRLRVRQLERWLPAGVRIVLTITHEGEIGKYTSFQIRRLRPPARADRCMQPGSVKPVRCPKG